MLYSCTSGILAIGRHERRKAEREVDMIVKIKNSGESWTYLECSIIHSTYETLGDIAMRGDALIIFNGEPLNDPEKEKNKNATVLRLESNDKHLKTVITDSVCYVLNDRGDTIDRI